MTIPSMSPTPTSTVTGPPQWQGHLPLRLLARLESEPLVGAAFRAHCDALRKAMAPRTLEFVALGVSSELGCLYSWHGHCQIARRCGLSEADIAGIAAGAGAFTGFDAIVLTAVGEQLRAGHLTSETKRALGEHELSVTLAVGTYRMVAELMHGIGPEPAIPDIRGLETPGRARATHAALVCNGMAGAGERKAA